MPSTQPPILAAALREEPAFLSTLEGLVTRESPTHDKAAADRLADHLQTLLAGDGWTVEREARDAVGDHLIARWGGAGAASDGGTLLLTHYDTVWPLGTLERMPFRRDGNEVRGPGALDMKAGIAAAVHARRVAAALGLEPRGPVTLLVTSDEEAGSLHSRALIEEHAREHARVLVLEPSTDAGAIKIGRKGTGEFRLRFRGIGAHAGNNPADGASALRELAHALLYVEDLGDGEEGTTVNLTVARGGTVSNVIAEEAEAKIDMRVLQLAEAERVEAALRAYRPRDPRVEVTIEGGLNRPPLEPTERNGALWDEARARLAELGLELDGAVVGGGSDGNFTSALGVPTLDGLGSSGAGPHARHEHIRLRETLERLALLTALLTKPG